MYARFTVMAVGLWLGLASSALLGQEADDAGGVNLNGAAPPAAQSQTLNATTANGDTFQAIAAAIEDLKKSSNQNFANLSTRLDMLQESMVTRAELDEAIQKEMDAATASFAARADLKDYVPRAEFEKLQSELNALRESVSDQATQIGELRQEQTTQYGVLNNQAEEIRTIVNAISRTDSQQRPILDLNSSMQSQEFQQDLSGAIHGSLRRQGRLLISNQMSTTQYLRVNGQWYTIPPFTSNHPIEVPVGTLTTELVGEAPKNWTVSPPNYEQGIVIAPRQASVVVATPTLVYAPY